MPSQRITALGTDIGVVAEVREGSGVLLSDIFYDTTFDKALATGCQDVGSTSLRMYDVLRDSEVELTSNAIANRTSIVRAGPTSPGSRASPAPTKT